MNLFKKTTLFLSLFILNNTFAKVGETSMQIQNRYKKLEKIEKEGEYSKRTYRPEKLVWIECYIKDKECVAERIKRGLGINKEQYNEIKDSYNKDGEKWFEGSIKNIASVITNSILHYRGKKLNDISLILKKENYSTVLISNAEFWKYKLNKEAKKEADRKKSNSIKKYLK